MSGEYEGYGIWFIPNSLILAIITFAVWFGHYYPNGKECLWGLVLDEAFSDRLLYGKL
jgi:hypothetical protein